MGHVAAWLLVEGEVSIYLPHLCIHQIKYALLYFRFFTFPLYIYKIYNIHKSKRHQSHLLNSRVCEYMNNFQEGTGNDTRGSKPQLLIELRVSLRILTPDKWTWGQPGLTTANPTTMYCTDWSSADWPSTRSPRPADFMKTWKIITMPAELPCVYNCYCDMRHAIFKAMVLRTINF